MKEKRIPNGTEVRWSGQRVRVTSFVPESTRCWAYYRVTYLEGRLGGKRRTIVARHLEADNPEALEEVTRGND